MNRARRTALLLIGCFAVGYSLELPGEEPLNRSSTIDLETALRLAGARNLDIQIARERLNEARAGYRSALEQFFPWLSPGVTYRRHEGNIQGTEGEVLDVSKQSYAPGATMAAQWEVGNALYKSLETHQLAKAAGHALDSQRHETILAAAQGYFDLARAQAEVGIGLKAVDISSDYERQVQRAVEAGIAFKGDALRVQVQTQRDRLLLHRAREEQRIAAARLAQILHLDSTVELVARDTELVPLSLVEIDAPLDSLVQRAIASRPELKQSGGLISAARESRNGAVYGPLIPNIGVSAFVGGLGGGVGSETGNFGDSRDYLATVSWRIGPGGLFDFGRINGARAREQSAKFLAEKVNDEVVRQVVQATTRMRSLADQIATAREALDAAEETLRLSRQRKEYGVGIVLETIQAEKDLTRAGIDYINAVAEFNKAQYALSWAIGGLTEEQPE